MKFALHQWFYGQVYGFAWPYSLCFVLPVVCIKFLYSLLLMEFDNAVHGNLHALSVFPEYMYFLTLTTSFFDKCSNSMSCCQVKHGQSLGLRHGHLCKRKD